MNDITTNNTTDETVPSEGISKRRLFAGAAALLAASAVAASARPGAANAGEPGSLAELWREHRRRYEAINTWVKENGGRDVPQHFMDWADAALDDAGKVAPRSDEDWAALVLIALTIQSDFEIDEALDEIVGRCCEFDLPGLV